jgi:hypothetical protein
MEQFGFKLFRCIVIFGALWLAWLLIKITLWFLPIILLVGIFFSGVYILRKNGVIKPNESVIEAIKRFLNQ